MTVPIDYTQASSDFDRFMLDLRQALDLQTTHQAWGALLGVFDTFRRRLQPEEVVSFAKALPPLLRLEPLLCKTGTSELRYRVSLAGQSWRPK